MKAQLLEKVLGNIKKPEDFENNNYKSIGDNDIKIQNDISNKHPEQVLLDNMPIIKNKKKRKKSNPFEE